MPDILPVTTSTLPRIAWNSVLDDATITSANTTESDGAIQHVADWMTWTFWRPTGASPYQFTATLAEAATVNGWAFAGHDAEGTVLMEYWNGAAWVAHSTVELTGDGAAVYLLGDTIETTKLRFTFDTITFLAVLWAGLDVELPEGCQPGWTDPLLGLRADITPEFSREGVFLGAAHVERWKVELTLSLRNVDQDWAVDHWIPFLRTCSTQPFFLHWNRADFPNSACFCTQAKFGGAEFSQRGFVNLDVTFDADPGFDRRLTPSEDASALLTEDPDGPLLLE